MADSANTAIKEIKRAAKKAGIPFTIHRNGAKHPIYNLGGQRIPIPHSRVHHRTLHLIRRECEPILGTGWWRHSA